MSENKAALLKFYLFLGRTKKKLIRFLYEMVRIKKVRVFPHIETIAKFINRSPRQTLRIIKEFELLQLFILGRKSRFNKSGKRSSNDFILDDDFIDVYRWLAMWGYLDASKACTEKILKHWDNDQKCHPKTPKSVTPKPPFSIDKNFQHKDSFYRDIKETNKEKDFSSPKHSCAFVSNALRGLEIPLETKIAFSKHFSEHILIDSLEVVKYQVKRNRIKTSPIAYFWGVCRHKQKLYKGNLKT